MRKQYLITLLIILCLVFSLLTVSCSYDDIPKKPNESKSESNTESTSITESESINNDQLSTTDYDLVEINGDNYIIFNKEWQDDYGQSVVASLEFPSIEIWKDSVINNKLSDSQKIVVNSFPKDETGILVCDFNNLFIPQVPADCSVQKVTWEGEVYSFSIDTPSDTWGYITYYPEKYYESLFQSEYVDLFNRDTVTVDETYTTEDNKNVTIYHTSVATIKDIRYTLSIDNVKITVEEKYLLSAGHDFLPISSSVPYDVALYCEGEGVNFIVQFFDFNEKPQDLWLSQFNMVPYVEKVQ